MSLLLLFGGAGTPPVVTPIPIYQLSTTGGQPTLRTSGGQNTLGTTGGQPTLSTKGPA